MCGPFDREVVVEIGVSKGYVQNTDPNSADAQWEKLQRIYGRRHSLFWPWQFGMSHYFKVITIACVLAAMVRLLYYLWNGLPL